MKKDDVNELLKQSIGSPKEVKLAEKNEFLGTFRERVVLALTQSQVRRIEVYGEVERTIRKYPGITMLLNGEMDYNDLTKYITIANQHGISYRAFSDYDSDTEIGLVLAMPEAVDVKHIYVEDHNEPTTAEDNNNKNRSLIGRWFNRLSEK